MPGKPVNRLEILNVSEDRKGIPKSGFDIIKSKGQFIFALVGP